MFEYLTFMIVLCFVGERVHEGERGSGNEPRGDRDGLHQGGQRGHVQAHQESHARKGIR